MNCIATLAAAPLTPDTLLPRPLVFVDGAARPQITVMQVEHDGPLDNRTARLTSPAVNSMTGGCWTIALPLPLTTNRPTMLPMFCGRIAQVRSQLSEPGCSTIELRDEWSVLLERPVGTSIDALTVGQALEALIDAGPLGVSIEHLPAHILDRVTDQPITASQTIGSILAAILRGNALCIHRHLQWRDGAITEHREVRHVSQSRTVSLPEASVAQFRSTLKDAMTEDRQTRPIRLRLIAEGAMVESTFNLIGAWPSHEEGQADSEYARSTSSDFDSVANVYRRWVLNEDGAFEGERFDATSLFDDGRAVPTVPLRFDAPLTRDGAGQALGIIVEYRTDGVNWKLYPGRWTNLADRAGLYLADDALPADVLAAGQNQTLEVRVTATLRSPLPVETFRWIGNPFMGPFREIELRIADRFAWRTVDASSKFATLVASGELPADESDDRALMATWLSQYPISNIVGDRSIVQAARVISGIHIGDRLRDGTRQQMYEVAALRHDWARGSTQLTLEHHMEGA